MYEADGCESFAAVERSMSNKLLVSVDRRRHESRRNDDKGSLMLTHYCKLGSQPRMRADRLEGDAKTLAFNKVSFTFQDQGHFTQKWMLSKDGKEVPHRFEFTRGR